MNANKFFFKISFLVPCIVLGSTSWAIQNLDSHGQSKVSNAMAKKWSQSDASKDGYQTQQSNSVVNVGSKKSNDCVVNVGTVQKGQKAPKDIVVTTKEVINVCK